jgi:hypothetical protein
VSDGAKHVGGGASAVEYTVGVNFLTPALVNGDCMLRRPAVFEVDVDVDVDVEGE